MSSAPAVLTTSRVAPARPSGLPWPGTRREPLVTSACRAAKPSAACCRAASMAGSSAPGDGVGVAPATLLCALARRHEVAGRAPGVEVGRGVDGRPAVGVDLEMQVRRRALGVAGVAHVADRLPGHHLLALHEPGGEARQVRVVEVVAAARRQMDVVAADRGRADAGDGAVLHGHDRRAVAGEDVVAFVAVRHVGAVGAEGVGVGVGARRPGTRRPGTGRGSRATAWPASAWWCSSSPGTRSPARWSASAPGSRCVGGGDVGVWVGGSRRGGRRAGRRGARRRRGSVCPAGRRGSPGRRARRASRPRSWCRRARRRLPCRRRAQVRRPRRWPRLRCLRSSRRGS